MQNNIELITNTKQQSFYKEIQDAFKNCKSFYFSVAFINYSGLQLLIDELSVLEQKGVCGKIITTDYLTFTEPNSLRKLRSFGNIETKVFVSNKNGFHTKGYIFEYDNEYKVFIGSSNITQSAFKENVEWNVKIISKKDDLFVKCVLDEFASLMERSDTADDDFIDRYEKLYQEIKEYNKIEKKYFPNEIVPKPNTMQEKALVGLSKIRSMGEKRALVISATATGKTYMAAFDVKRENPDTMLFIVHNDVILSDAKETFENVIKDKVIGFYKGSTKDKDAEYFFANIATISREEHYKRFDKKHFKYIIIDEAHRSASPSYKKILDYFEPDFLLGMTATPERTDAGNVFELFNYNIAIEVRLRDALTYDLVVPFHYFGITDVTADLTNVDINNIDLVAQKLKINKRVEMIIEKMEYYGFQGNKRKCIGFCVSVDHAEYMSSEFNKYGYKAKCLSGKNSIQEREKTIEELEDDNNPLEFIFTVDIFNEGVDIRTVNLILMLRPTESAIIFTQQLGRGLRKAYDKEFVTVLDFIGNYNKSFLIPIALSGSKYYDADSLRVSVQDDFSDLPGCTNIHFDKKAKEQILNQLDKVNFSSINYLKEEYNEFKKQMDGRVPYLVDYIIDNAPDPVKFIKQKKNYPNFISCVEEKEVELFDENELKLLNWLSSLIPVKRVYDLVVLKALFIKGSVSIAEAKNDMEVYLDFVNNDTLLHSFKHINGDFFDEKEIKKTQDFFVLNNNTLVATGILRKMLQKEKYKNYLLDVVEYGILRYKKEFGSNDYGMPFLKLYETYAMRDLGLLTNNESKLSSIRGQGVWRIDEKSHCFFVNLHKGEDIKDSINYKDKFIDNKHFQWQSPNSTPIDTNNGQDYANNVRRNVSLHLFVRKQEKVNNNTIPFIYVGKINALSYEGEKPITIQYELENELTDRMYKDFTMIVGDDNNEEKN